MTRSPIYDEYDQATSSIAFLRHSGRGLIEATGSDTIDFLQGMVTADVKGLIVGNSHRAAMLDTKGHILADLILHRREKSIFIETDQRTLDRVLEILNRYLIMEDVTLTDRTGEYASISLLGPEANKLIDNPYVGEMLEGGGWTADRSVTALRRFDIWVQHSSAAKLQDYLIRFGIAEITQDIYEVLRIEAREPAWGTELTEAVLLPEAEIADIVSYTKGCYVGQEIIARLHSRGHTNRVLRQVLFSKSPDPVLAGSLIQVEGEGREVARITSAVKSPRFNGAWLALAYVRNTVAEQENGLIGQVVDTEGNSRPVEFSVLPLY